MTTTRTESTTPTLNRRDLPGGERPKAVVLVLHGGTPDSEQPVDGRSASWRRAAALQGALAPGFAEHGWATWLLRYRVRGWNGGAPIEDARAALREVAAQWDVPVALLGHSMGARTAVHVADDAAVRGVVALAPWFPTGEPVAALRGKRLVAAHGRRDRITSARQTRAYVDRAAEVAASTWFVDMGLAGHYLLWRPSRWNAVARSGVATVLDPAGS